ncbi:type II secretion system protein [Saccharobesus litoralis]|nr:type II secretion system protein [Saccharobesus litoralis]
MLKPLNFKVGFTLLELMIVILVLGVLAATVLPKSFDNSGVDGRVFQQQLISLLRLQQTKAMQQTDHNCHRVFFTSSRFGVTFNGSGNEDCTETSLPNDYSQVSAGYNVSHYGLSASDVSNSSASISLSAGFTNAIYFNSSGCPVSSAGASCSTSDVLVTISDLETYSLCIESQGYIHEGACY